MSSQRPGWVRWVALLVVLALVGAIVVSTAALIAA